MEQRSIERHERLQESLLAPAESALLRWLAERMPPWVKPDHLTLLGFASMLLAGLCYYLSRGTPLLLHAVNLCIIANWFGDSLDGTLARYRRRLRPRYGYYIDHIIDNLGALCLTAGLAFSDYMTDWVAVAVLVSYLLLNINIYLATSSLGIFQISFWKFGPTELRLLLIIGNLFLLQRPEVMLFGTRFLLFDVGGVVAAGVLFLILLASMGLNVRKLYVLERY